VFFVIYVTINWLIVSFISMQSTKAICIVHFQVTCGDDPKKKFGPTEIIEINSLLLFYTSLGSPKTFSQKIKPVKNPILTKTCVQQTLITQEQIEKEGVDFLKAIELHQKWIEKEVNGKVLIVTHDDQLFSMCVESKK
jgi:inhibitor of KinA sporulation pathway (predicted exonuclease)